jgi:hypothetical protein
MDTKSLQCCCMYLSNLLVISERGTQMQQTCTCKSTLVCVVCFLYNSVYTEAFCSHKLCVKSIFKP